MHFLWVISTAIALSGCGGANNKFRGLLNDAKDKLAKVASPKAALSFTPADNDFGNVQVSASSAAETFTLSNTGDKDATSVHISLSSGTHFTLSSNTCGTSGSTVTVPEDGSCTFDVTFAPVTSGAKSDTITATFHDGQSAGQSATASITGNADPIPTAFLSFSPASRDFGGITVGVNSAVQTFTVTNGGSVDATDVFIALTTGTDYSISNNTCGTSGARITVAASDDCTFDITFSPSTTGALDDTITATYHNGASAGQTATAELDGVGLSPAVLAFSPASHDFGDTIVRDSSDQSFTISNSGDSSATDVFITLTTGTEFSISSNNCGTSGSTITVPAGEDCAFDIDFSPESTGAKADLITVNYHNGAAAGQTATATLDGNGIEAPSNLSYSHATVVYLLNTQIPDNTPTITGSVASWSITPPTLPTGLSFNTGTGVISGTPAAQNASAPAHDSYTIRATNAAGWVEVQVNIAVLDGFAVNNTGTGNDANPGDGFCATAGGQCTLLAAITEAINLGGDRTIYLADNVDPYPLSTEIDYSVNNNLTSLHLTGESRDGAIVDLSGGGSFVYSWVGKDTVPNISFTSVTFTGGTVSDYPVIYHSGEENPSTLIVSNARFIDNNRAAIATGAASDITLIIENSEFIRNSTDEHWHGAAIHHTGDSSSVRAVIRNSDFTDNSATSLLARGVAIAGRFDIYGSTFSGNTSNNEAGAYDVMSCDNGEISIIQNSRFLNNSADGDGGVLFTSHGCEGSIQIINSLFSENSSGTGAGAGTLRGDVTVELENSTIIGNTGDCGGAFWGGAYSLVHSTVVRNESATCEGGAFQNIGFNHRGRSIIAENTGSIGPKNCEDDIFDDWGPGTYMLYDSAGGACGSTSGTDIVVADVGLAVALADNGGPVETLAIETTSPALDAIPAGSCSLATDARGYDRPKGPACDIGAFEAHQ